MPLPRPAALLVAALLVLHLVVDGVLSDTTPYATPREIAQLCLHSCDCQLLHQAHKAHLRVQCYNVLEFPAIYPGNTTVVILNNNPLNNLTADALQNKNLTHLDDFQCSNCMLTSIDRAAFRGLADLKTIDLSDNLLVELTAETFADQKHLVVVNLVGNEDLDCAAFLTKFAEWRPKVKVECDAATTPEDAAFTDDDYDVDTAPPRVLKMDGADNTDAVLEDDGGGGGGDDGVPLATPITPTVQPIEPDADPAAVFPPWSIAVIAGVGAIIVSVAVFYAWKHWTEVRACCCCGEYQQP